MSISSSSDFIASLNRQVPPPLSIPPPSHPILRWFRNAADILAQAQTYEIENNIEHAYIFYKRFASFFLYSLSAHPSFRLSPHDSSRRLYTRRCEEAVEKIESLKKQIIEKYNRGEYNEQRTTASQSASSPIRVPAPSSSSVREPSASLLESMNKERKDALVKEQKNSENSDDALMRRLALLGVCDVPDLPDDLPSSLASSNRQEEEKITKTNKEAGNVPVNALTKAESKPQPQPQPQPSSLPAPVPARDPFAILRLPSSPGPAPIKAAAQPTPQANAQTAAYPTSVLYNMPPPSAAPLTTAPSNRFSSPVDLPAFNPAYKADTPQSSLYSFPPSPSPSSSPAPPISASPAVPSGAPAPSRKFLDFSSAPPLRRVYIPASLPAEFMRFAAANTAANVETCAILTGVLRHNSFYITHVFLPPQHGKADQCAMDDEEVLMNAQLQYDVLTLGWIHTHPTQTCFLSSIDLHTHYVYELMLAESIAIVMAPSKVPSQGIFNCTASGLQALSRCSFSGFHRHEEREPLYKEASHYVLDTTAHAVFVDLRHKAIENTKSNINMNSHSHNTGGNVSGAAYPSMATGAAAPSATHSSSASSCSHYPSVHSHSRPF